MEMYENGTLDEKTIGLKAPFGSAEALCELVDMTAAEKALGWRLVSVRSACVRNMVSLSFR